MNQRRLLALAGALLLALLSQPEQAGLSSPFPAGVRLLDWTLEEGRLHLDLSEQYNGLSGVNLTLADCCIALTFCQLEGVEAVYVTVEGHEIPYRQSQLLRGEDVLLSGAEEEPVYIQAELWYPKADGSGLGTESRQVRKTEDATLPQAVLSAWLEGPSSEALEACLPEGAQVHELTVTDGVCTVNLSAGFAANAPADPEAVRRMVYALVNTLGGLEQIDAVRLLAEGEALDALGGVPLEQPIVPDTSLERD